MDNQPTTSAPSTEGALPPAPGSAWPRFYYSSAGYICDLLHSTKLARLKDQDGWRGYGDIICVELNSRPDDSAAIIKGWQAHLEPNAKLSHPAPKPLTDETNACQPTISPTPAEPGCAPATCSAVELARRLRDFDEYVDACDEAADWIETADARIKQLEECLATIEQRLREDTTPILELIKTSGNKEAGKAWKSAIYASCIRAQVFLAQPNRQAEGAAD